MTVIEYGLILGLMGVVAIVGMFLVRDRLTAAFTSTITTPGAKACAAPCTAYDVLPAANIPGAAPVTLLYENIAAIVSVPFTSAPPTVTGGSGSNSFSISAGSLPSGWTLSPSTGVISGMSSSRFNTTVEITVVNSGGTATTVVAMSVGDPGVRLSGYAPFSGVVGVPYTSPTPTVTGASGSFGFSISAGSLPAGLVLDTSTGVISGTPTAAYATANVTVMVTDSVSSAQQTISMTVAAGCSATQVLVGTTCTDIPPILICYTAKKNTSLSFDVLLGFTYNSSPYSTVVDSASTGTVTPPNTITFKTPNSTPGPTDVTFAFTVTYPTGAGNATGTGTGTLRVYTDSGGGFNPPVQGAC